MHDFPACRIQYAYPRKSETACFDHNPADFIKQFLPVPIPDNGLVDPAMRV